MRARHLEDCLSKNEAMARLAAHAGHLQKLQQLFEKVVPATLARSCRVANYKAGAAIIHAENGAAATKLRQISPSLAEAFRSEGKQVTEIRIKVQPLNAAPQQKQRPQAALLGAAGRASIARLNTALPEGELKSALEALLARSFRRPPTTR